MYYICKLPRLKQNFVVNEIQLYSVVSELNSQGICLIIKHYVSEDELPEAYIELKPHC